MDIEVFDNENWQAEAIKLFTNIKRKKAIKLIALFLAFMLTFFVTLSFFYKEVTFTRGAIVFMLFVILTSVAFQFLKVALNEVQGIWHFEIGKYIMASLKVQGNFSKRDYERVGKYFTNVDYKNVLTLRHIALSEIMYFKELPRNLFNAKFGLNDEQMILDYFDDEAFSQKLKQQVVLEKWCIEKIITRYRKVWAFKHNFPQYDIAIMENIFLTESNKVFENALNKYERDLNNAEQAMIDYSVDALLQNANKSSNINIVENVFVSCLKIMNSEKLEEYMLSNKLNALDFSREERILMPKIYTFSNKYNRTNVELAKKTKMLIKEDLAWNISNQKRLDSLLEAIGWSITGE